MYRRITALFVAILAGISLNAQTARELKPACDSISTLLKERTGVSSKVSIKTLARQGDVLNIRFNKELGDYPWYSGDTKWFKKTFKSLLPDSCKSLSIGNVTVMGTDLDEYIVPRLNSDGTPVSANFRRKDPKPTHPFIEKVGEQDFVKGLTGRNMVLWQSHGRYYEENTDRWEWQRAPLFQTVEDMYTQTYVLQFLIPMLENAGAYVLTPRERDPQPNEVVADNDPAFEEGRGDGVRTVGTYRESGEWSSAGTGFADQKAIYSADDNPFRMGTARKASCDGEDVSKATWTPDIPKRGMYSVYISYKSLPNSTPCAHYTVNHLGASEEFVVNQTMGGGTWIYLGTFEFDKGEEGNVVLDSAIPTGYLTGKGKVITADAVRFGGGMGKVARGKSDVPVTEYVTSGLPCFAEGSLYNMQWAGADTSLLHLHPNDYARDYGTRGAWVGWMSGGSRTNPEEEGLKIPFDLTLAFHTDAGVAPGDSIIGTLGIYTLKCEDKDKFPNGEGRLQSRTYTDFVQTQVVNDIRKLHNPRWTRRSTWDRSYSESRTTTVPAMLIEFLSHQNFADMKYGLDPVFRFDVSRAIYKGMLKYLSARYGFEYAVQPLPVNSFATSFTSDESGQLSRKVKLSWKPTVDSLETTANPTGYILYTRIDDGGWNDGEVVDSTSMTYKIEAGKIFSFKVVAFNEGGKSFPSEVLSVGIPEKENCRKVAVVNNFTRISAPAWFDTTEHAGFINDLDAGVPYMNDISFIGNQYEFRRDDKWKDDDSPGFGGSYTDEAGKVRPGNTFDYTHIHGKALMAAGCAFHSLSNAAFCDGMAKDDFAADIICGKQVSTVMGNAEGKVKFTVFTKEIQDAIKKFTSKGGNVIVSGSYIGTDIWDKIYPLQKDSLFNESSKVFVQNVLGYKWMTNHATRKGELWPMTNKAISMGSKVGRVGFNMGNEGEIYSIETPDGIVPVGTDSHTILRYVDTNISAATCFNAGNYKTVCAGFPLEIIKRQKDLDNIMSCIISYFTEPKVAPKTTTNGKKKK